MKHKTKHLVIFAVVLGLALISTTGAWAGRTQSLYLNWTEVVPYGSGDPNMNAEATVDINPGQGKVCYTLRTFLYPFFDWPPTGAYIHKAPAGQNGPLVVDLNPDFGPLGRSTTSGCVDISTSLAHEIQRNPEQYYLLETDSTHPDGAVRGQFSK